MERRRSPLSNASGCGMRKITLPYSRNHFLSERLPETFILTFEAPMTIIPLALADNLFEMEITRR